MRRWTYILVLGSFPIISFLFWFGSHFKLGEWKIVGRKAYADIRCARGSLEMEVTVAPKHEFNGPRSEMKIGPYPLTSLAEITEGPHRDIGETFKGRFHFSKDFTTGSKFWVVSITIPFWAIVLITSLPFGFAIRNKHQTEQGGAQ